MSDTVGIVLILVGAILLLLNLKLFADLRRAGNGNSSQNDTVPAAQNIQTKSSDIDEATVAAITAAITLILDDESVTGNKPRAGFIVRQIKRISR